MAFDAFVERLRVCPSLAEDMPHVVVRGGLDHAHRHEAILRLATALRPPWKQHERIAAGGGGAVATLCENVTHVAPRKGEPPAAPAVPVKYSTFPRGLILDVAANCRTKNGAELLPEAMADALLAFVKDTASTKSVHDMRRIVVIERFDKFPSFALRRFRGMLERVAPTTWLVLTLDRPFLDAAFLGHFCVLRLEQQQQQQQQQQQLLRGSSSGCSASSSVRSPAPSRFRCADAATREAVSHMVSRLVKARTCADVIIAKVPRCVTALGARGFIREVVGHLVEEWQRQEQRSASTTTPSTSSARAELLHYVARCDAMQAWSKNQGNIAEDDEAFIDTVMMYVLLHVHRVMFADHRQQQQQQQQQQTRSTKAAKARTKPSTAPLRDLRRRRGAPPPS